MRINVRAELGVRNPETNFSLEADVAYLDLKLCFDYQVLISILFSANQSNIK